MFGTRDFGLLVSQMDVDLFRVSCGFDNVYGCGGLVDILVVYL